MTLNAMKQNINGYDNMWDAGAASPPDTPRLFKKEKKKNSSKSHETHQL